MRKSALTVTVALIALFLNSCGNDNGSNTAPIQDAIHQFAPLNLIVVLDLSNRLVSTSGQVDKDQQILDAILKLFEKRQKRQAYIASNDQLKILVAKQPDVPLYASDSLLINMAEKKSKIDGKTMMGYPKYKYESDRLNHALRNLYRSAMNQSFTGADLYSMFCTELPQSFLESGAENRIVVLTDGYLLFDREYQYSRPKCTYMRELDKMRREKEDWKARFEERKLALCPCEPKPDNEMEVLMLETAPLHQGTSVFEFQIVEHYWQTWFQSMGIEATLIPHNGMVSTISTRVEQFINK